MSAPCQCGSLLEYHKNYGKCENCDCREWKECYHDNRQFWCRECVEEPLRAENERLKAQCQIWSDEATKQATKRDENFIRAEDLERKLEVAMEALNRIKSFHGEDECGFCGSLKISMEALRQINEEPK